MSLSRPSSAGSTGSACKAEISRGTSSTAFSSCVGNDLPCYESILQTKLVRLCEVSNVFWHRCVKFVQDKENKYEGAAYDMIANNRSANVSAWVTGNMAEQIITSLKYQINRYDIVSFLTTLGFEMEGKSFKIKAPDGMCDNGVIEKLLKTFIADVNEYLLKIAQKGGRQTRRNQRRQNKRKNRRNQSRRHNRR